jgi:hypothetical protein
LGLKDRTIYNLEWRVFILKTWNGESIYFEKDTISDMEEENNAVLLRTPTSTDVADHDVVCIPCPCFGVKKILPLFSFPWFRHSLQLCLHRCAMCMPYCIVAQCACLIGYCLHHKVIDTQSIDTEYSVHNSVKEAQSSGWKSNHE